MRVIRLHLPRTPEDAPLERGRRVALPKDVQQHVAQVLRLRDGAEVTIFDGTGGEWSAQLVSGGRGSTAVDIGEHHPIERESPLSVTLWQGLARGERMDLVVQKATELGVTRIVPIATARSVVQLDTERGERRLAHWRAVAAAACEQCGRNRLPEITAPIELSAALALPVAATDACRWLLDPEARRGLGAALESRALLPSATVLVGPEGGLESAEIESAVRAGFEAVSLGPRVLRTETAGLAVLATLQSRGGDLA